MQHPTLTSDEIGNLRILDVQGFAAWQTLNDLAKDHAAVQWAVYELKALAHECNLQERQLQGAARRCVELENGTDGPIADALKSLGWVPPAEVL